MATFRLFQVYLRRLIKGSKDVYCGTRSRYMAVSDVNSYRESKAKVPVYIADVIIVNTHLWHLFIRGHCKMLFDATSVVPSFKTSCAILSCTLISA